MRPTISPTHASLAANIAGPIPPAIAGIAANDDRTPTIDRSDASFPIGSAIDEPTPNGPAIYDPIIGRTETIGATRPPHFRERGIDQDGYAGGRSHIPPITAPGFIGPDAIDGAMIRRAPSGIARIMIDAAQIWNAIIARIRTRGRGFAA